MAAVSALALGWAVLFGWLALTRYLAGGAHAEDLGFTDQVLWNFLRGQWFRMTIYQGATWNTELDITRIARPDSLLAFHFEPLLLALVPLYALGGRAEALLVLQAVAVALGALPAYRLGRHLSSRTGVGVTVAALYLLSPFGQWAVLADFHTSALAAPLILLALERIVVARQPWQGIAAATLAAAAREDVGLVVAAVGVGLLWTPSTRRAGMATIALGLGCSVVGGLVIRAYSGGQISPFDVRYEALRGGALAIGAALSRPPVLDSLLTVLLSGAWLGVLAAPLALVPALPTIGLNALSSSPWMAAGKAHYSVLLLPIITVALAVAFRQLLRRPQVIPFATAAVLITGMAAYVRDGAVPLGGNYAPAIVDAHAGRAARLAGQIPVEAAVTASAAVVPWLSDRQRVYVFPALEDAEYVLLDLRSSPAPTSAGDVFYRLAALLTFGNWQVLAAEDGLLLLQQVEGAPPTDLHAVAEALWALPADGTSAADVSVPPDAPLGIESAQLLPARDGAISSDGPRWTLRAVFRPTQPLPAGSRLDFWIELRDGERMHVWDLAETWWRPPDQWQPGQPVTVDVPDVPIHDFVAWHASLSEPGS